MTRTRTARAEAVRAQWLRWAAGSALSAMLVGSVFAQSMNEPAPAVPIEPGSPVAPTEPAPIPTAPPADTNATPPSASLAQPIVPKVSEELQQKITQAAAQGVARVARYDLFLGTSPDERDFWLAAELLQIASDLDPRDEDILRLLLEARAGAGQSDEVQAISRKLLAIDPKDTVLQLRVISADIAQKHATAEARLAAYDRFLGPSGAAIDASVRSRLALDAALLSREIGDLDGFSARLRQALELDSTNKDAATLAFTLYSENVDDPAGKFDLMLNVLRADPFDHEVYLSIAREMSVNGAYKGAERFYAAYQRVMGFKGLEIDSLAHNEILVLSWLLQGSEEFVRTSTQAIQDARDQVMEQREQLKATGVAEEELPDPLKQRLPLDSERVRVLAALSTGKKELIEMAVREMGETVTQGMEEILTLGAQQERGIDPTAVREYQRVLKQEATWLRLWAGLELDQAARDLEELKKEPATDPRDSKRMDAWLKLRRGQLDEAESDLRAMAESGEVLAQLGLAVLAELRGRGEDAIDQYLAISERVPGAPAGAFALTRAQALAATTGSKRVIEPSEIARKLDSAALAVPAWLEGMLENPREFMTLRAELIAGTEGRVDMFDKVKVRVRLRNVSRIPLAVGAEAALNSRLLVVSSMRAGTNPIQQPGMHAVASLDRRLRLMPREELTVDIWPDNGVIGMLMQERLRESVSAEWRVLQGFLVREGMYEEGPQCLSADVGSAVRPALALALAKPSELIKAIDTGTPIDVATAVLAFRDQVGTGSAEGRMSRSDAELVLDALLKRFATMDRASKLLVLAVSPNGSAMVAMAKLDDLARRDRDPAVARFALMARTPGADADALQDAAWPGDPLTRAVAKAVRERLQDNKRTFARPRLPEDLEAAEAAAAPVSGSEPSGTK